MSRKNGQARATIPTTDRAVLAVGGRFLAYFVAFAGVISVIAAKGGFDWLTLGLAKTSISLIAFTGVNAVRSGNLIELPNRILSIDLACTAIFIVALFGALVLAYPVNPRMRLMGLAAGIPLILFANVARIVAVAHVAVISPQAFDFVHDYLFQVGMLLVSAALWAAWLAMARRHAR